MQQVVAKSHGFIQRSVLVSTAAVGLGTPNVALALSLHDVVQSIESSPYVIFGIGCATGAIFGGLAVGLAGRNARLKLDEGIREAQAAATRADAKANQMEAQLKGLRQQLEQMQQTQGQPKAAGSQIRGQKPQDLQNQPTRVVETVEAVPEVKNKARARILADVPEIEPYQASKPVPATSQSVSRKSAPASASANSGRATKRQRSTWQTGSFLLQHFGSAGLSDLPVIDRGAERAATEPLELELESTRPRRRLTRGGIIDRRVPRFDESLFPGVEEDTHANVDQFETAMHAMDETLEHAAAQQVELVHPESVADGLVNEEPSAVFDASSYVDSLVHEEFERNRSGSARRFSRAHLKVFEGTGDLSAARRALRSGPRHMGRMSKEA